ncbi:MAG: SWIM zinc finger family protein [Ilumatobacteraceae bacterium]|nr:SWIM zinc finger family protein [Ilumatobacteraceae bacterium]
MSTPRKPYGTTHPGRLPSTVIKVLAAELSDPERLRRGKRYAKQDAVTDIDIAPGIVTCEILGSRSTPYVATLQVTPGDGMPVARDLLARCSCPDDDYDSVCKHIVAAMFVLADEFLVEPQLLDIWRNNPHAPDVADDSDEPAGNDAPSATGSVRRRHLQLVRGEPGDEAPDDEPEAGEPVDEPHDRLAEALSMREGSLPSSDEISDIDDSPDVAPPRNELAADSLASALRYLTIDWD